MQELDSYIDRVQHLPPAPKILPQLLALLNKEDVDASQVVDLMMYDPALTAASLQLANSAYFAGSHASDLNEAVTRLGFNRIFQLVATVSGAQLLAGAQKGYGIDEGELWQHSVASAIAAQAIAEKLGDDRNLVFTCALLHDLGKIILSRALEHVYGKIVEDVEKNQQALIEAEKKLLGVQHAEIGGRLLARWKFPANIVHAVCFHHEPILAGEHKRLAAYVYLSNLTVHFLGYGFGHHAFAMRGRAEALRILGLRGEHLAEIMIQTFESFETINSLLTLKR
ncbi:MAG TPA: HDOD domain-containing protein [Verrucomicrobiae bacterium]|nr:HDOD domain-containing protein [Verrucomicrobiae bacterium]